MGPGDRLSARRRQLPRLRRRAAVLGEFLSAWERYRVEPLRFDDAGDQVAVVVHIVGRTHELDVDETRSSLLTVRDGRVVRVQSFADAEGAREAAGL